MKIKLFVSEHKLHGYDNYESVLSEGITDWEECTEEEYKMLLQSKYVVIRQVEKDEFQLTLKEVLNDIEAKNRLLIFSKKKWEEEDALRAQKKKERAIAKAKKTLEQYT